VDQPDLAIFGPAEQTLAAASGNGTSRTLHWLNLTFLGDLVLCPKELATIFSGISTAAIVPLDTGKEGEFRGEKKRGNHRPQ
jgi:hypothetical protein